MAIVGVDFSKILVEKKDKAKGKININNNVAMKNVTKNDLTLGGTKQSGVKFEFEYKSSYGEDFAQILLGGSVLYLADEKMVADIVASWEKDKKLKKEIAEPILNAILSKCNIQSIILSNTVNLPPPMPMPTVDTQKVDNK